MKLQDIQRRVDELITLAQTVLLTETKSDGQGLFIPQVDSELFVQWRTSSISFLLALFGKNHPYTDDFPNSNSSNYPYTVAQGLGILKASKQEIDGGWLVSFKGIVSAEIFSNFLEMAVHLLEQGYKDPAAVMTGSVLEEHLRQLCQSNGLPTNMEKDGRTVPKKADTMNAELAKALVYNALSQKSVTAWLDLRNKAAHGKYHEYTIEEVRLMQQGVTDFIARTT